MKEDSIQPESFSLHEHLKSLNTTEYYDLISSLLFKKPELNQLVLEWLKEKKESVSEAMEDKDIVSINDNLLFEHWEDARSIISDFNELGGGPEDDEEEAYGYLENISELIKEGGLSTAAKLEFLDEAFEEYNLHNSGFEDSLMDIFFEICRIREEWEYLVKKLDEHPSKWRTERIMIIQRDYLHDEEAYLHERMQILTYGMDYWDLVEFYLEKGDQEKALETAEERMLRGEGWVTMLFEFLWEYYSKKEDIAKLERLVQTALSRNTEEKNMLDRLFEYLRICMDKGMKETVLKSILNPPKNRFAYSIDVDFGEFADELKNDFPKEIIEFYWQKAYQNIPGGNRKTYWTAAKYLKKVKDIYFDVLRDESGWIRRFSDLKSEFKKRPAFLEEVSKL